MVGDGTWLTVGEAVERLRPVDVHEQTVRRMADAGELRMMRIGIRRDRRILAEDVDALRAQLLAQAYGDTPPPEA